MVPLTYQADRAGRDGALQALARLAAKEPAAASQTMLHSAGELCRPTSMQQSHFPGTDRSVGLQAMLHGGWALDALFHLWTLSAVCNSSSWRRA